MSHDLLDPSLIYKHTRAGMQYGSFRPSVKKSIHLFRFPLPELFLFKRNIEDLLQSSNIRLPDIESAFAAGLARYLCNNYCLNVYSSDEYNALYDGSGNFSLPSIFYTLFKDFFEDLCLRHRFHKVIEEVLGTLDLEGRLEIKDLELIMIVSSFPNHMPFENLVGASDSY